MPPSPSNVCRFVGCALAIALALPSLASAADLPARLKPYDKDGDGRLSAAEFPDPVLFAKIDADHDGYLTVQEIRAYYTANPPGQARPAPQPPSPKPPRPLLPHPARPLWPRQP